MFGSFSTLSLPPLNEHNAAHWVRAAAEAARLYQPPKLEGRGIVIPAGGRYVPSAYVTIKTLRHLGCQLPVQVWHLGPREFSLTEMRVFNELGVELVDARAHPAATTHARLNGWEVKAFALLHCPWQEALLLDADNLPLQDVTALFSAQPYQDHGALFWPDRGRWSASKPIWRLTGIPYRDEPEFESGQILVNRVWHWPALVLANWFNCESGFWYKHIHGDKDTFRLAWRALELDYGMIPHASKAPWPYFWQKDPDGQILFHHGLKWNRDATKNAKLDAVPKVCYEFFDEFVAKCSKPTAPFAPLPRRPGPLTVHTDRASDIGIDACHVAHISGVARSLKPHNILELGLGTGAVTTALLQAIADNQRGQLTLVDNWYDFGGRLPSLPALEQERLHLVTAAEGDFVSAAAPVYDLIVSDADHNNAHRWWEQTVQLLRPGGCAFFHDVTYVHTPNLRRIYEESRQKYAVQLFNVSTAPGERCERGLLTVWRPLAAAIRPRVAVLQFGNGDHTQLLDITSPVHADACRRYGFDYFVEHTAKTGKHIFWEKVRMMQEAVANGYEYVVWLDTDAFWKGTQSLLDVWAAAPPAAITAGTFHGPRAGSGHYYDHINAGVLFLRNHKNRAAAFLEQWMGTPDDRHPWGDQHALNKLYLETPSLVHVLDHAWNSLPHIAAYRSSAPQIVAYHGQSRLPTTEFSKLREEYQKHHGVTLSNE